MRNTFIILASCSLLLACGSTRKLSKDTASVKDTKDSTTHNATYSAKETTGKEVFHSREDSIGKIGGGSATLNLKPADLAPVTDINGDKQGRTFRIDSGNTSAEVSVDKDGNVRFRCKQDSVLAVLKTKIKDSINQSHRFDSVAALVVYQSHTVKDSSSTVTVKQVTPTMLQKAMGYVLNGFALIGMLCTAYFIFKALKRAV